MPDRHIFIRTVIILIGVTSNEEGRICSLRLKEWVASFFTDGDMAAIATGIGDGMTYLTGQFITMQRVLQNLIRICPHLLMTSFASRHLRPGIAVGAADESGILRRAMAFSAGRCGIVHFRSGMAVGALHPPSAKVYIAGKAFVFAQVFIANPAAMTGCAVTGHRGGLFNYMATDQPAANRVGLTDMAITQVV